MTKYDKRMVKRGLVWIFAVAAIWHILSLHNELSYCKELPHTVREWKVFLNLHHNPEYDCGSINNDPNPIFRWAYKNYMMDVLTGTVVKY